MNTESLTILFAGAFPGWSQRDDVIKIGLEREGHRVTKLQSFDIFSRRRQREFADRFSSGVLFALYLTMIVVENILTFLHLLINTSKVREADVLFSANASDYSVFAVKLVAFIYRKPVAFDPHGGLYYANVLGRQFVEEESLEARLFYRLDEMAAKIVDTYVTFTKTMKTEFNKVFGIPEEKMVVVYTGVDETRITAVEEVETIESEVNILYWGTYIPFHGTSILLDVARELEDIEFVFLGTGGVRKSLMNTAERDNLQNVSFKGYVDESKLFAYIDKADIVCNRFQSNPYGDIGIGNKAAESAFMSKVMLSAESPAINELFTDGESALLFEPGGAEPVIQRVTKFYKTNDKKSIESNARQIYDQNIRPEIGARRLIVNLSVFTE